MVIKNTFYLFLIRVNQFVDKITFLVSFREKYTKNKPESSQKWCKNERFRFEKCLMWWCYNRIWTRWYSDSSKTDLIKKKFWNFQKTIVFNQKSFQNLHFWQEFEHFRSFLVIFGEFLSAFASKNRISCPFWQEKWHRENDLDWPFEFHGWFMVFNHDKPLIYNFLTNECRLESLSLKVHPNSSSKTQPK